MLPMISTDVRMSITDNLIIDTGSSNTWVGANTPYTQTSTSTDTGRQVVSSDAIYFFIRRDSFIDAHFCSSPAMAPANFLVCSSMLPLNKHRQIEPFVSGEEFTDQVTLGSLVINDQSIGVALEAEGFTTADGILGYALMTELLFLDKY